MKVQAKPSKKKYRLKKRAIPVLVLLIALIVTAIAFLVNKLKEDPIIGKWEAYEYSFDRGETYYDVEEDGLIFKLNIKNDHTFELTNDNSEKNGNGEWYFLDESKELGLVAYQFTIDTGEVFVVVKDTKNFKHGLKEITAERMLFEGAYIKYRMIPLK